jgi:hypothetical protein
MKSLQTLGLLDFLAKVEEWCPYMQTIAACGYIIAYDFHEDNMKVSENLSLQKS